MSSPLHIGVIGAGMVAQTCHIANLLAVPDCSVIALADLRPELATRAAADFGIPRVYPDHRALLRDPDIDAVVVVTRPIATGPIVLDALRSGRHVLSEKPMAHTVEQARTLVAEAEQQGVTYAVGFMKRFDPGIETAKATIDAWRASGECGAIVAARAYCYPGESGRQATGFAMTAEPRTDGLELWPVAPDWLPAALTARYAHFLNVTIHDVNVLRYLLGAHPIVRSVDFGDPRAGSLALGFDGVVARLEFGDTALPTWHEGVEVVFERGRLRVALPPPFAREVMSHVEIEPQPAASLADGGWAFARQARAFVNGILEGTSPRASGSDSRYDLDVTEAAWKRHVESQER